MNYYGMSRKEWLERRRNYLGGSDAAPALGISPFVSRLQLARDKWGELEDKPTEAMERGAILEPLVAHIYQAETGHDIAPGSWLTSDEYSWMAATPDLVDETLDSIVQLKTASTWARHKWGDPGTDDIPSDYMAQVHHEMIVTKTNTNVVGVLFADESTFRGLVYMAKSGMPVEKMYDFVRGMAADPNSKVEFNLYPIVRNDGLCETIIEGEREFWEKFVKPQVLPPDDSIPEKSTEIITADKKQADIMRKLRDAEAEMKLAKSKVDEFIVLIKTMIGDKSGITANGVGKITFRAPTPKDSTNWEVLARAMKSSDPDKYDAVFKKHTVKKQGSRSFRKTWAKE